MREVLAALLGALAAGGLQTCVAIYDRRRSARSTLIAIAAEVQTVCMLIRHQRYFEAFKQSLGEIENGTWDGTGWIMDIRSHYFSVFESNASNLGLLRPNEVVKIVHFYGCCKSVIDSTRPDGPFGGDVGLDEKAGNIRSVMVLLDEILKTGDLIVQLPDDQSLLKLKIK